MGNNLCPRLASGSCGFLTRLTSRSAYCPPAFLSRQVQPRLYLRHFVYSASSEKNSVYFGIWVFVPQLHRVSGQNDLSNINNAFDVLCCILGHKLTMRMDMWGDNLCNKNNSERTLHVPRS
jgi:hypothetical protein